MSLFVAVCLFCGICYKQSTVSAGARVLQNVEMLADLIVIDGNESVTFSISGDFISM